VIDTSVVEIVVASVAVKWACAENIVMKPENIKWNSVKQFHTHLSLPTYLT